MPRDKYDFYDKKNNVSSKGLFMNGLAKRIIIFLLKEDKVNIHEINKLRLNRMGRLKRVATEDEFRSYSDEVQKKRYFERELINGIPLYISNQWDKYGIPKLRKYIDDNFSEDLIIIPSNSQTTYDKKHTVDLEFFNQEDIELLNKYAGKPYDKNNPTLRNALKQINGSLGQKLKFWHESVVKKVFPNVSQPRINSSILNTGGSHFRYWIFGRAYPRGFKDYTNDSLVFKISISFSKEKKNLCFDINIQRKNARSKFQQNVKVKIQHEILRIEYTDDTKVLNWNTLIQQSVHAINKNLELYWSIRNEINPESKDLDYFNQEDFSLLKNYMGNPYDKTRSVHQDALEKINHGPLKKWRYWHKCVGQRLYPNIEQPKPTNNIVSRASFFKSMLWSKILPYNKESDEDDWLSFCLNISQDLDEVDDLSFKIAIETRNDHPKRPSLLKMRPEPLYISVDDQSINNWESLIGQSVDYIKQHESDYWEIKERFTIDKKSTNSSKNLILYGPPGTGKTYKAKALAVQMADSVFYNQNSSNRKGLMNRFEELLDQNRIVMTTFHQSYSYEDFVEGIKPKVENNQVVYDIEFGVFRDICQKALDESDEGFVLIIDEINRGNVAATFGELITLIEKDKRIGQEEEIKVQLPYSKKLFGVPSNVHIIGTMNTADRSVEALDSALRRRFDFQEIGPNTELLNGIEIKGINLKHVLEQINKRIEILLDRNHAIGHSYLLKLKEESQERDKNQLFIDILYNNIIPLLQEHFYSDISKIGLVLGPEFVKKRDLTADDIPKLDGQENSINISTKYEIQKISLEKLEKALSNFKETQNNENS